MPKKAVVLRKKRDALVQDLEDCRAKIAVLSRDLRITPHRLQELADEYRKTDEWKFQ